MATERRSINATTAPKGGGSRTAFGTVPGAIGVPPNIYSQTSGLLPNVSGVSDVIGSELSGQVSPATMKALQNAAATFGVTSGMPGVTSGSLAANSLFGNIAGFSEGRQRQGVQDYLSSLTGIGSTMTNPNLAAEIASRNATLAAAPDPEMAAKEQMRQWMEKYNLTSGLGGPSGGTGAWGAGGRPPDAPSYGGGYGRDPMSHIKPFGFGTTDTFMSNFGAPMIGDTGVGGWWGSKNPTPTNPWDNMPWNAASPNYDPSLSTYKNTGRTQGLSKVPDNSPYGRGYQPFSTDWNDLQSEYFPETGQDFWTGYE